MLSSKDTFRIGTYKHENERKLNLNTFLDKLEGVKQLD